MKQQTIAVFVIAVALATAGLPYACAQTGSNLIVAGQSIGQTHLGRYGAADLAKLPNADADDSGMGRYRSVWLSKEHGGRTDTLYIYSVANDPRDIQPRNGVSIWLIRVTSPWYRTSDGISTGSTLPRILHGFPGARPTDQSQTLYDDAKHGIAFEFAGRATAGSACIAIMVHPPGNVNLATAQDVNDILRSNRIQP
jgi:hypothetical protein